MGTGLWSQTQKETSKTTKRGERPENQVSALGLPAPVRVVEKRRGPNFDATLKREEESGPGRWERWGNSVSRYYASMRGKKRTKHQVLEGKGKQCKKPPRRRRGQAHGIPLIRKKKMGGGSFTRQL